MGIVSGNFPANLDVPEPIASDDRVRLFADIRCAYKQRTYRFEVGRAATGT